MVLHGFGLAIELKHIHQISSLNISYDFEVFYSYYASKQDWFKVPVHLNVLNLLKMDTFSSLNEDSVMLYSRSRSLTCNKVNIQRQSALTIIDIALASSLILS